MSPRFNSVWDLTKELERLLFLASYLLLGGKLSLLVIELTLGILAILEESIPESGF
jgi:hypothetical protein